MSGVLLGHKNPFRWRGYEYEEDTTLYYLVTRFYDSILGRFINEDDHAFLGASGNTVSYNLYTYCENDPVNNVDPMGRSILMAIAIGFAVGMLFSGTITIITNKKTGKKWYDGLAISMLAGGVGGAISCMYIPGWSSFVSATVFGATGNVVAEVILGEIKSIDSLISAIRVGAFAGFLGQTSAELLIKGIGKHFATLTKAGQKAFLSRIGKITNKQLQYIRSQIKKGLTPKILKDLIKKYGWDVIISAFVSSTVASAS